MTSNLLHTELRAACTPHVALDLALPARGQQLLDAIFLGHLAELGLAAQGEDGVVPTVRDGVDGGLEGIGGGRVAGVGRVARKESGETLGEGSRNGDVRGGHGSGGAWSREVTGAVVRCMCSGVGKRYAALRGKSEVW